MSKTNDKVIAIFCSDIHLSLTPPVWRSAEPDWLEAQKRPLLELQQLKDKYNCPIFCAGDVFDKWNSPAELINFALEYLPDMYAIPGQHDLPLHNLNDIKKSAFWTLIKAGKIIHNKSETDKIIVGPPIRIEAFSYGIKIEPIKKEESDKRILICLAHQYVWIKGYSYPNVPKENVLYNLQKQLKGYEIAVFGDNHKHFYTSMENTQVWNCGALIRRKSDEKDYRPCVGLLTAGGHIKIHYLDISQDKHLTNYDNINSKEDIDIDGFIKNLENLGDTALNFVDAVKRYFEDKKTNKEIMNIIFKAMEN